MSSCPKRVFGIFLALFFTAINLVHASTVSVGSLSRDTGSTTISDSLNSRDWLRWDLTNSYSYEQVIAAIGVGGIFQGFSIARNDDAQLFSQAIFGSGSACTQTNAATCGTVSGDLIAVLGDSAASTPAVPGTVAQDIALFLSDNGTGLDLGWAVVWPNADRSVASLYKANEAASFATASQVAASSPQTGWLLYRASSVNVIPEPSTLVLFALGFAGLIMVHRRTFLTSSRRSGSTSLNRRP